MKQFIKRIDTLEQRTVCSLGPSATAQALTALIERCIDYHEAWPEGDAELARRIDQLHVDLLSNPPRETR